MLDWEITCNHFLVAVETYQPYFQLLFIVEIASLYLPFLQELRLQGIYSLQLSHFTFRVI